MERDKSQKERVFAVELTSKQNLKNISLTNGSSDAVLLEGTLGEFVQATFKEGVILEVLGTKGTLRLDLGVDEIQKPTKQDDREETSHE